MVDLQNETLAYVIFGAIIWGLICAFACYQIAKAKGYPDYACGRGMGWAYLLNLIWVIVALCHPAAVRGENIPEERDMPLAEFLVLSVGGLALVVVSMVFIAKWDTYGAGGLVLLYFAFLPLIILYGRI